MKICRLCPIFYSDTYARGGLAPYFYSISTELKKLGVEQTIITPEAREDTVDGFKVYRISPERPFSLIRTGAVAYKKIRELEEDFDLIHYHNPMFASISFFKDKMGIPIVQTIHGTPTSVSKIVDYKKISSIKQVLFFQLLTKYGLNRVNASIILSNEERTNLIGRYNINPNNIFFIPSGVNPDLFSYTESQRDIDILYVGRFALKKGLIDLLKAIFILKKEIPNIKTYLIGGREEDNEYHRILSFIEKLNLKGNVHIKPPIQQIKLKEFYNRSKIFVLSSYEEGMPKVILEAMACRLPVVATNICGNNEAVIDQKTGFLVPQKGPDKLAKKMKILLEDESLRDEMGKFGRERVKEYFTWQKVAKQTLVVYHNILKEKRG